VFGGEVNRRWLGIRESVRTTVPFTGRDEDEGNPLMNPSPTARWRKTGGSLVMMVSTAGTLCLWLWHAAPRTAALYILASHLFPALFVFGLGYFLFPGFREEWSARGEDISRLSWIGQLTPRWWAIFAVAMLAGLANRLMLTFL
jgi:hypothetical protein